LSAALSSATPGQTVHLKAGTYRPFVVSRSGNNGAWIVIEGEAGTIVSGVGARENIAIEADYVVLKNLTLSASDFSGITTGNDRHDLIIEGNTLQNVSRLCSAGPSTTHLEDTGINVGWNGSNVLVLGNTILSTALQSCVQSVTYNGPGQGIGFSKCTGCVFMGNTITGAFRDGITSDNSNNSPVNVDIADNVVTNYVDDGVESKGDNVNVRLWGNVIKSGVANSCLAGNTNTTANRYGPLYVFRNICKMTGSPPTGGAGFKGPGGPAYFFHNSIDTSGLSPIWSNWCFSCGASATGSGPYVLLNNAATSSGSMIEQAPSTTVFNYSVGKSGGLYVWRWNGTTTLDTMALFRTATGQEAQGLDTDPLFSDAGLHLRPTSPAIDAGVILNNFNSPDSAWPYMGSAPDVGAHEVASGSGTAPEPPSDVRIVP
jgi:hypothetical protein